MYVYCYIYRSYYNYKQDALPAADQDHYFNTAYPAYKAALDAVGTAQEVSAYNGKCKICDIIYI